VDNPHLKDESIEQLFKAILTLKTEEECSQFFEDICAINEIKSIAQRLQVASMLQDGKTYQHIEEETGASSATISRVKRFLSYGPGGYRIVLNRIKE